MLQFHVQYSLPHQFIHTQTNNHNVKASAAAACLEFALHYINVYSCASNVIYRNNNGEYRMFIMTNWRYAMPWRENKMYISTTMPRRSHINAKGLLSIEKKKRKREKRRTKRVMTLLIEEHKNILCLPSARFWGGLPLSMLLPDVYV